MELFKISGSVDINNTSASNQLDQINNKADKVAQSMKQKFESIGSTFSKIGDKMTQAGTVMTATLTTGVVGLATAGIKYNMQMEDFQMNLTTLLGSSDKATKLLKDLQDMAATTPFETTDLISATETMIGFGISAKDSQKYLGMIGDIAMGDSNKLAGLSLAFSQVQSTGKLTGQDLLQMINQGFNPLKYISEQTGESMASLKERMSEGGISAKEVASAFEYATSKGQPFYKGMENGAKTVSGRISTLKDNFMILIGKLTESLLPTFSKIVDHLTVLVEKFTNMDEKQREQILKWAGIVAAAGPVLMIFGKITSGIGGLISAFGGFGGQIAGIITKNGGLVSSLTKITGGMKTVLNPINLVKGAFTGLKGGIANLLPNVAGLVVKFNASGGGLSGVLGVLKMALSGAISGFGGLIGAIAPVVAPIIAVIGVIVVLKDNWDKVVQTFKNFIENTGLVEKFNEIKEKIQPLVEKFKGLKDLFTVIGTVVIGSLVPTFSMVAGLFNGLISAISPLIDAIGGVIDILAGLGSFIVAIFTGDMEKAGKSIVKIKDGIVNVFKGLWGAVKGFLKGFVDGVIGFFKGLWDTLVGHSIVPDTINSIIDWFKELLGKPLQFVKNMKDKVVNFFGDLKNKAIEKATGLVNGAKEKFNSMKTAVVNKANELKNGAVEKFNSLKSSASEKFNSIKSTISDKVSQAKTKAVSVFQSMNSSASGKLGSLVSTVSSKFGSISSKIGEKMNAAKDKVSSILSSMKSSFNNWKGKLKMPHIKITGDWDLKKLKFPKFSVDWYDKAMDSGMILNEPTIFGVNRNGQLMGGGETGSETIVGTNSLMNMIQSSVGNQNLVVEAKLNTLIDILLQYLPILSERQLLLDGNALVGRLAPRIDRELGDLTNKKGRGR